MLKDVETLLGDLLVDCGAISHRQLGRSLAASWMQDSRLGQVLIEQALLSAAQLESALDAQQAIRGNLLPYWMAVAVLRIAILEKTPFEKLLDELRHGARPSWDCEAV